MKSGIYLHIGKDKISQDNGLYNIVRVKKDIVYFNTDIYYSVSEVNGTFIKMEDIVGSTVTGIVIRRE